MQPSRLTFAPTTPSCTVTVRWCLSMSGCSRRITSGGAMQGPLRAFGRFGLSTPANAPAGIASEATSASAARSLISLAQPHLDVAGRAHVAADVAADALRVVGIDIAPGGRLVLLHAEHRGLRAVDDAVVALEAQPAAHAALALGHRLLLRERGEALLEVAERLLGGELDDIALVARDVAEVAEEQLVVGNDVARRAVLVVVHRDVLRAGAAHCLARRLVRLEAPLGELAHQVEGVHVDLRAPVLLLAVQEAVDAFGGDPALADRRGEQVRPQHVAAGEEARLARDLVVLVGAQQPLAVVEALQTGEVDRLADRRDDEVGGNHLGGALVDLDLELRADELRLAFGDLQAGGAAVRAAHHLDRRPAVSDHDALGER